MIYCLDLSVINPFAFLNIIMYSKFSFSSSSYTFISSHHHAAILKQPPRKDMGKLFFAGINFK